MTLWLIVRRSLYQHLLSTLVTGVSIALAGGLLMSVWVVKNQAHATFTGQSGGWDAVLGARGAKLQLVLNAIFHLEASPGNIPFDDYEAIGTNRAVAAAVPIAVGDNYRGYRLVGTLTNYFDVEFAKAQRFQLVPGGRMFEDGYREAVVGSFVAQKLGLKVGSEFQPYHGLNFDPKTQHEEVYVVVGIMEPSNTPADRVIWIPLAGLQNMSGHDAAAANDVSAVLVKLRSPLAGQQLDMLYNRQGNRLTFAWPIAKQMADLFEKFGWFDSVLELVAWLVALVATGAVLASLYNSLNSRRRDIAILRALGARRRTVFSAIVLESATISALGMAGGFLVYFAILSGAASVIRAQTGVVLDPWQPAAVWLWAPAALIGMGALAGILPALKAYRSEVADGLAPES
ncbi:MAG: ABC transporter permease [Verrucomicrobia bacterium]|nr:ABC transporter permease [Verrucomicrobiota bacterium]